MPNVRISHNLKRYVQARNAFMNKVRAPSSISETTVYAQSQNKTVYAQSPNITYHLVEQ